MNLARVVSVRPKMRPWALMGANYFLLVAMGLVLARLVIRLGGEALKTKVVILAPRSVVGVVAALAADALILALLCAVSKYGAEARDGRLRVRWKLFGCGALFGLAMQALSWSQFVGLSPSAFLARVAHAPHPAAAAAVTLVFAASCAIGVPIIEEIFMRGLLFDSFAKHYSIVAAVILNAVCFSSLHWEQRDLPLAIMSFVLGVVFAIVRHRAGNLSFGYGAHIAFNATFVFVVLTGGGKPPSEVVDLLN